MSPPLSPEAIDKLARKRAGAKLGWYLHAAVYLLVNLFLFLLPTDLQRHPWTIFPALGWGLGLVLHGVSVWFLAPGSGLREGLIQRERERLQREQDGR